MSQYTCISCRVAYDNGEKQRLHYKTDWHRYNLKRKVAELPPVTAEDFQRRAEQQRAEEDKCKTCRCEACHKTYGNEKAYENHLNSKKHKENAKAFEEAGDTAKNPTDDAKENVEAGDTAKNPTDVAKQNVEAASDDSDVEEVDSDEWEAENPIENNNCLFCSHHSRSIVRNVRHMTAAHSFFVPDVEYCIDLRGLLVYLGEKITLGFMCLWCNEKGKSFHSADAARKHMVDKGHCKMIHEGVALAEYADFYDYSSSYPDAEDKTVNQDEEIEIPQLDDSDYQLVLPSGLVIGHRSLMRYYQQNLDPNRQQQVAVNRNSKKLHKVLAHYRALGWTASQQEAVARNVRDIHFMKRMQAKLRTKLEVKSNKFQKHFRQQINF